MLRCRKRSADDLLFSLSTIGSKRSTSPFCNDQRNFVPMCLDCVHLRSVMFVMVFTLHREICGIVFGDFRNF